LISIFIFIPLSLHNTSLARRHAYGSHSHCTSVPYDFFFLKSSSFVCTHPAHILTLFTSVLLEVSFTTEPGSSARYSHHPSHSRLVPTFSFEVIVLVPSGWGTSQTLLLLLSLDTQNQTPTLRLLTPPSGLVCNPFHPVRHSVSSFLFSFAIGPPIMASVTTLPSDWILHSVCLPTYSSSYHPFRPCTISNCPPFLSLVCPSVSSSFEKGDRHPFSHVFF